MYNDDSSSRITCNQNTFFAAFGNYLEFNCLYGASCSYNTFHCPQEIEYGVACQITFDDSTATANTYFTRNGIIEVWFLLFLCFFLFVLLRLFFFNFYHKGVFFVLLMYLLSVVFLFFCLLFSCSFQ